MRSILTRRQRSSGALQYGVHFYQRSPELAEDHVVQDGFNYDFLTIDCDVAMVNPVSPLVLTRISMMRSVF